jgi:hypothetical protein
MIPESLRATSTPDKSPATYSPQQTTDAIDDNRCSHYGPFKSFLQVTFKIQKQIKLLNETTAAGERNSGKSEPPARSTAGSSDMEQ